MNWFKKILSALFFVFILTTLAIWMLIKSISPNAIKEMINKQLITITTPKSHIDGQVVWHLFPHPGIKITQIIIVDDVTQATLLIDNLLLNLKFNSLLRGQLVFKEIQIDGLSINIKNPGIPTNLMSVKNAALNSPLQNSTPVQFDIDRFSLTHGQISITQSQQKITLKKLQIDAKQLNLKNSYFPLNVKTTFSISTAGNKIQGRMDYDGSIRIPQSIFTNHFITPPNTGIKGLLGIENFIFNQVKISKISAHISTKKSALVLNPLKFSLYSGKSVGDLSYQFSTKKTFINQKATGLNANSLFKNLFGKTLVNGRLDMAIHGSTNLQDSNWINSLMGDGYLTIKEGILYFVDLQSLADNASKKIHLLPNQDKTDLELALSKPLINSKINLPGTTPFQLFNMKFRLKDNNLIGDSLLLQTITMELKGNARLDLNNDDLQGTLSAKLLTADNIVGNIQQLLGGSFPLKLSGKINQPEILPNDHEINPIMTRYILKSAIKHPVKQIKNQIYNLIISPKFLFPH